MTDFDELEIIADSVRRDKCSDGRIKSNGCEPLWHRRRDSANQKSGNRLRMSVHPPSLPKLKFMQDE